MITLDLDYPGRGGAVGRADSGRDRHQPPGGPADPPGRMSGRGRAVCALFALAVFAALLLPLVVVVGGSFDGSATTYLKFPPAHLSLKWYYGLPASYVKAFLRSLVISSSAAVLATVIGVAAAVSLARSSLRRSAVLQTFFQLPLQIPFVIIGVVFLQFYYAAYDAPALACNCWTATPG